MLIPPNYSSRITIKWLGKPDEEQMVLHPVIISVFEQENAVGLYIRERLKEGWLEKSRPDLKW